MSIPQNKNGEPVGTDILQGSFYQRMQRDQVFTKGMGGPLSEQPDPTTFTRILDIGCAVGGWLIEVAKTYPTIPHLIGVDINGKLLEYARTYTEAQQVSDRIHFRQMDVLSGFDFPAAHFDLVNLRSGVSFLRTWEWPRLIEGIDRILRPGGVIRLSDIEEPIDTTSPAFTRLEQLLFQALHQAGYFLTSEQTGLTTSTTRLLTWHGLQNIQTRIHTLECRAGTADSHAFYEDIKYTYTAFPALISRWVRLPIDYQETYQQALKEIQQADFRATWTIFTTWGQKRPV